MIQIIIEGIMNIWWNKFRNLQKNYNIKIKIYKINKFSMIMNRTLNNNKINIKVFNLFIIEDFEK